MKNILLLCMSPVKKFEKLNKYVQSVDGENIYVEGYMTNEAPTKALIKRLHNQDGKERLDKVVMICSTLVREKTIELLEGENDIEKTMDRTEVMSWKHKEFYMKMIEAYAPQIDSCYSKKPIDFVEVEIGDFTNAEDLTKAVLEAADEVTKGSEAEDIHLYLDFNGGSRTVAFMLLATANLMKVKQIEIRDIMSMNYDAKIGEAKDTVPIQNMMPVFGSIDLVGGINEYIRYGRIEGLREYFAPSKNEEIHSILGELELFANKLQLCRTSYIMDEKENLLKTLNKYIEKRNGETEEEKKTWDTYDWLFLYVLHDIVAGCKELLGGELPDVIKWCVDRGFVQQALTFCSEQMPAYFWEKRIIKASELEDKWYKYFNEQLKNSTDDSLAKLRGDYKDTYKKDENKKDSIDFSRYAYNWLIRYIFWANSKDNKDKVKELIKYKDSNEYIREFYKYPYTDKVEKKKIEIKKLSDFNLEEVAPKDTQKDTEWDGCLANAAKLVCYAFVLKERIDVRADVDEKKLGGILMVYFVLKNQRNKTNHANADGKEWNYEQLCSVLKQLAAVLKKIK